VNRCTLWLCSAAFVSLAFTAAAARAAVNGYYRNATIHDDQVVFASEGDLWKVSAKGGLATRLTSHPAPESSPHFSPDGKWIAFTADYLSSGDVYVMPSEGGEPKRLTFHPSRETVAGWTPDGKCVLFTARRSGLDSEESMYKVAVEGGEPEKLNIGPASWVSYSPDMSQIAFNRHSWNSNWKRYRGGTAPDVWYGNLKTSKFNRIAANDAADLYPMWVNDRVYFMSERNGNANLFSCAIDGSGVRQHTKIDDYSCRAPDTDGKSIVFSSGADLWVYDVATDQANKLDIQLPTDRIRERDRAEDASKTFESFQISPEGKHVVVASRGELWTLPTKGGGRIVPLTESSGTREREPRFSPDGTKVACVTDETGEQELAVYDAKGKESHKVLTKNGKGWMFAPVWSPDSKRIAVADMTGTLFLVDPTSGEMKQVDQDKNWELTEYNFSPDGKYLAYTKISDNRLQSIWVYDIASGKSVTLSSGFTSDYSPSWDPKGKYLFFLSNRYFNPILDDLDREFLITKSAKPCLAILAKDGKSPFLPDDMLEDSSKDEDDSKDKDKDKDAKKDETTKPFKPEIPSMKVDLDGLASRVVEFPVEADNFSDLTAGKGKVFWIVRPVRGIAGDDGDDDDRRKPDRTLHAYDLKKKKDEVYLEKINGYSLTPDGKRLAWRKEKEILVADAGSKPGTDIEEKVSIASLPLRVNTGEEWKQIFAEAWRLQRDFYWAENMAGVDWPGMRTKYEPLVSRASTRGELNDILSQMFGELGTSHTYVFGGDSSYTPPAPAAVGCLGADIEFDKQAGLHRFVKVFRPEPWETNLKAPLTMTHANVKDGDYIIAINNKPLGPNDSVDERLTNWAGKQVLLTVCSNPDKSDARDVQVETLKEDFPLRYGDYCRRNREYVDAKSSGKIGYMHLPDMGGPGLSRFVHEFYPQIEKDGLVIDERNNHGGFVSQMIIEKLARKAWAYDRPRRGLMGTYPDRVHLGYKVCLINQHAGSDGDIFPDSFRTWGIGPLIGTRTWGGVIGIRMDKPFMDGGGSSQPEFAWWDPKRGWALENHGVDPDIEIDNTPEDYIAGRDAQLDRAIDELTKMMREKPVTRPQPPPFPDRSGRGAANAR
jgi:tricorn protease